MEKKKFITGEDHSIEENTLLNTLKESDYTIWDQKSSSNPDLVFFHHVKSPQYIPDCNIRLYINAKRKHLLDLVCEILDKMENKSIYLKFMSDKYIDTKTRNEKIVIYTNNTLQENGTNNLNEILTAINEIKKENPSLLEGCEITNPFMKKIDGFIGYAQDPDTNIYHFQNGHSKEIGQSYNSFLSQALEEGLFLATEDLIPSSENNYPNTTTPSIPKLKHLYQTQLKSLINKTKFYLAQSQ